MRNKKISIKFLLYTDLKPKKEGKVHKYPLYMRVVYNRKCTNLRSHCKEYYTSLEEVESLYPGRMAFEEKLLKRIVGYEIKRCGERFKLRGMGKVYEQYAVPLSQYIDSLLKKELADTIKKSRFRKYEAGLKMMYEEVDFLLLYEITGKLFPDLEEIMSEELKQSIEGYRKYVEVYPVNLPTYSNPRVIDWQGGAVKLDCHEIYKLIQREDR